MDQYTLSARLSKIAEELPKLSNTINAMKITNTGVYGKNYEELSMDAAQRAEKVACSLRNLIFAANLVERQTLMERVAKVQGIIIEHTNDMVCITLPGLMPKRTKRVNTTFLTDPLYASLNTYVKTNDIPRFRDCVVCFSHIFDQALSARRIRDYDNLECKQIIDTVAGFVLTDDSGLFCDAYHTTEFGERDCTVLTIMEKSRFPMWLKRQEEQGKMISDF